MFGLLEFSVEPTRNHPAKRFDIVHIAAQSSSAVFLKKMIDKAPAYVNMIDNEKNQATPLHYAVKANLPENAQVLLAHQVNFYYNSWKLTKITIKSIFIVNY